MKKIFLSVVVCGLLLLPALSLAATVTATAMRLPTVSPGNPSLGAADVTVNAANGVIYNVTLSAGTHISGGVRGMLKGDGSRVTYYLYKDAARTQEWGDSDKANTYSAGSSVAGTGTGADQAYTAYGRVTTSGGTPTGSYMDQVTVTVHY